MSHVTGDGCSEHWPSTHNFPYVAFEHKSFLCLQLSLGMISWRAPSPAVESFHDVQAKICESGIFRSFGHYEMHSFHIPYITSI